MSIGVGDPAPDFTLPGMHGTKRQDYSLSSFLGQPVILAFYPGDNTPVCTRELNTYTREIERFGEVGAQVLAISPQSVASHDQFSCKQGGFGFPLLADEDKAVGMRYGVVGPLGFYRRSTFVVGADGTLRWVHRSFTGATFKPVDELVKAVRATL